MFDKLKEVLKRILDISKTIDKYKKDTVIQSLPTLTYVNRAKKFIEKNDLVMAEKILTDALELPQKDSLVYKYLGLVYEKTGKFDMAVENYQLSADLNPSDKNIWQRLGFALLSGGKFEQSIKSFENADKIQPNNTDTCTGCGMAYMKLRKYQDAYDKFLKAIAINKYNFSALFLAAVMEIKLGMYDKADSKLAFLSNVAPNEGNTFEYAKLKMLRGDFDNAIFYAKKSLGYNSLMLPAYLILGQLYTKKFDKDNAIKSFCIAFEKGLKTSQLFYEWGNSLLNFGMYEDAKNKFEQANELQNEDSDIMSKLALCSILLKDFDSAKIYTDKAASKTNNKTIELVNAISYYEEGKYDDSLQKLKSDDENVLNSLYTAKCYAKQDNFKKASEYFERTIEQNPCIKETYIDFTNLLIVKKDYKEAQRKLRKALKYFEDDVDLLNLMFNISYILVKADISTYNIKETLSIANKIEQMGADLFEYPRQKEELENILSESERN